jgi:alpha-L-fucosidase 2
LCFTEAPKHRFISALQTSFPMHTHPQSNSLAVVYQLLGACMVIMGMASVRGESAGAPLAPAESMSLWYRQPAKADVWVEALPIGNGRLGAMIYGDLAKERLQFNEDTLWSGKPHEYQHEGAVKYLAEIRKLLADGKQKEAEKLAGKEFMSQPLGQKKYLPFGDVYIELPNSEQVSDYRRDLNLNTAVASVTYRIGDVAYERVAFASNPDQVIVWRMSANRPGCVSFKAALKTLHGGVRTTVKGDALAFYADYEGDWKKERLGFEARIRVVADGGKVTVANDFITVENANSAMLTLAAATSFVNFRDISADPSARCDATMAAMAQKDFPTLLKAHLADHQKLYQRVAIHLGSTEAAGLPTDERLTQNQTKTDPALAALFFQYGRYLLIASSRPGTQPANLQGIWNARMHPPWDSKWTTNINVEMNYWGAETCNLSECHEPLFDLIDDLVISGRKTAQAHYGARGWVLHHNTDLWRGTAPINASDHGIWVTGGAWLCHHLWEHYQFTGNKEFLAKRAYPAMKEAALFFTDFLVKDPKTGWLISTPSNSPEQGGLIAGPAMDHQIIRSLFANTAAAAAVLGVDQEFAAKLVDMGRQIAPNLIGRHGQLQEWSLVDQDDPNEKHRHVSHLWALHPGTEITPATANLFAAAKQSLVFRGDEGTGWSSAWKVNLWARLLDGERAHRLLQTQLRPVLNKEWGGESGTYANLFDACPPFEIDGNFGASAGIAEMLLQSQSGEIVLLPALPKAWPAGRVMGLKARGGYAVDIVWQDGKLVSARIQSLLGNRCNVRYGKEVRELKFGEDKTFNWF